MSGAGTQQCDVAPWLMASWQRCLINGQRPDDDVVFNHVQRSNAKAAADESLELVKAAQPVMAKLLQAVADARYFAILTNAQGVVIDVNGPHIKHDKRMHNIARVGVDLSERAVGTTAIGGALQEQRTVYLHHNEHFFNATNIYSCAGAPLIGPDGTCVGMLDITGLDTPEHGALHHFVAHSAQRIENALTLQRDHQLLIRLNWPGQQTGQDADGLVCLDHDGWVTAANVNARNMLGQPLQQSGQMLHASDLFAAPFEWLFDQANRAPGAPLETVPTWNGLRLSVTSSKHTHRASHSTGQLGHSLNPSANSLRDIEAAAVRKAIDDAKGNVAMAAKQLGISRSTLYRRLGQRGSSS